MTGVLLPSDGSDLAQQAARRGLELLAPPARVTVLTVVPVTSEVTGFPLVNAAGAGALAEPGTAAGDEARFAATRADAAATVAGLGAGAEVRVEFGDPGRVICEVASSGRFDVIVLGSHGSGWLTRALLGSVSHYVIHHAPCPVLVVREASSHGAQTRPRADTDVPTGS